MGDSDNVRCLLCQLPEETKITGALSTKDEVTAHQNCLLFSSGLYCQSSPQFDDLFGFSVEDVKKEVKRGNRLLCDKCNNRGATVGCEVKRCKKSYHYPCAAKDKRILLIENTEKEKYQLYCPRHDPKAERNSLVNGHTSSPSTSKASSEAGPSKVLCLACEKTEGYICLESLSYSVLMLDCDQHAPVSHQKKSSGDSTPARQLSSSSSSSSSRSSSKRKLNSSDKREGTPSKRSWNRIESDDPSDTDGKEPESGMAMFAPLETDIDESLNSVTEAQEIRNNTESPTGSASGNQLEEETRGEDVDETMIDSGAESESLLLDPVPVPAVCAAPSPPSLVEEAHVIQAEVQVHAAYGSCPEPSPGPSPHQSPAGPPSPPCSNPPMSPTEIISLPSTSSSPPAAPPSDPEPGINSIEFWRNCNAAGCTEAIFTGFINEMKDLCSRIQSDRASQDDYDLALSVMTVSGKLADLVAEQQEELRRKQEELKKAAAAMKDVVSALR